MRIQWLVVLLYVAEQKQQSAGVQWVLWVLRSMCKSGVWESSGLSVLVWQRTNVGLQRGSAGQGLDMCSADTLLLLLSVLSEKIVFVLL